MKYCYGRKGESEYCDKECDCELIDCTTVEDLNHAKRVYVAGRDDEHICTRDDIDTCER